MYHTEDVSSDWSKIFHIEVIIELSSKVFHYSMLINELPHPYELSALTRSITIERFPTLSQSCTTTPYICSTYTFVPIW